MIGSLRVRRHNVSKHTFVHAPSEVSDHLSICAIWSESSLGTILDSKNAKCLPEDKEDSDQIAKMGRLIWVFVGHTYLKAGYVFSLSSSYSKVFAVWFRALVKEEYMYLLIILGKFSPIPHKNICCGYSLEGPYWGPSNEYLQHMFLWRWYASNEYPHNICFYGKIGKIIP